MTAKQDARKRFCTYPVAASALSTPLYVVNLIANANGGGTASSWGEMA